MNTKNYDAMEHAKELLKTGGDCIAPTGSCIPCMIVTNNDKSTCTPSSAYSAAKIFIEKYGKLKSIW